jgi:hypothetical protein
MNKKMILLVLASILFIGCSQQPSQEQKFYEALTKAAVEQKMQQEAVQQPFTETNIPPSIKPLPTPAAEATPTTFSEETYALYKKITGHAAHRQPAPKHIVTKAAPNTGMPIIATPSQSAFATPTPAITSPLATATAWCCTQQEAAVKAFVAAPGFFIKLIVSLLVLFGFALFIFGPPILEKILNRENKNVSKNK